MLLNNWLVASSVGQYHDNAIAKSYDSYLCLRIEDDISHITALHQSIQKTLGLTPFAILISRQAFKPSENSDNLINAVISLFFQPSYYAISYHPVLFLEKNDTANSTFINELENKCQKQGLKKLIKYTVSSDAEIDYNQFPFCLLTQNGNINLELLIRNWTLRHLETNRISELNILIEEKESEQLLAELVNKEKLLLTTEKFEIANRFYQNEKLLEQYQHQLYLKEESEKNNKMYLSIQKAGRADALEWYYYEYEILPIWYKRFGHIIKVIMGKRSFRSLFNDNIKKYKD